MNISNRNKWTYSIGGIGRDMLFVLVAMFMLAYVQYTVKLSVGQFAAISVIIIVARIFDGFNDPIMGLIIENTRFKGGKFRPWIMIGGLSCFIVTVLLFTVRPEGWAFVVFFGILYISWGITYTINDIAYWSLLPNLARDNETRNNLTNLVIIFASIGQFIAGGLIPVLVTGNAVMMYKIIGVSIAVIFIAFTSLTFFGVQETINHERKEKVSLKKMYHILVRNDQLRVMTISLLLYTIAMELFIALALNYFYLRFGYNGEYLTMFTVIFGLGTIASLAVFGVISNKVPRMKILGISMVFLVIGYIVFFMTGIVFPMVEIVLFIAAFFSFFGIGLFYVTMVVLTANTIEYNQYKTGERNESIIFSVRPLMTKIGAAIQQMIVSGVLILSGVLTISSQIADLEIEKGKGLIDEITEPANTILSTGTFEMVLMVKSAMALIPLLCMILVYIIIKKKYIISEEFFDKMVAEIG